MCPPQIQTGCIALGGTYGLRKTPTAVGSGDRSRVRRGVLHEVECTGKGLDVLHGKNAPRKMLSKTVCCADKGRQECVARVLKEGTKMFTIRRLALKMPYLAP